jgi:hypothetical protein
MASETVKAGAVAGTDLRNSDLAINSEHIRLEKLRVQYLAEVFSVPEDTALTIAELAFGGGANA